MRKIQLLLKVPLQQKQLKNQNQKRLSKLSLMKMRSSGALKTRKLSSYEIKKSTAIRLTYKCSMMMNH